MSTARILIHSQNAWELTELQTEMEASGPFEVEIEPDPQRVADEIRRLKPDAVVLVFAAPWHEVSDLAGHLTTHPELRGIPPVYISSTTPDPTVIPEGWVHNLGSPMDVSKLRTLIKQAAATPGPTPMRTVYRHTTRDGWEHTALPEGARFAA